MIYYAYSDGEESPQGEAPLQNDTMKQLHQQPITTRTALVKEVVEYYAARASEYHEHSGYHHPYPSEDEAVIEHTMQRIFDGCDVLEIACGTGYWTQVVAHTARTVLATDVNPAMIAAAQQHLSPDISNVRFCLADAYCLQEVPSGFTGAFAVLWWCFIPRSYRRQFLSRLHGKLSSGAKVIFLCQLPDSDASMHRIDKEGDLIAARVADGRKFQIIKNIPTESELVHLLTGIAKDIQYTQYPNGMWSISYTVIPDPTKG